MCAGPLARSSARGSCAHHSCGLPGAMASASLPADAAMRPLPQPSVPLASPFGPRRASSPIQPSALLKLAHNKLHGGIAIHAKRASARRVFATCATAVSACSNAASIRCDICAAQAEHHFACDKHGAHPVSPPCLWSDWRAGARGTVCRCAKRSQNATENPMTKWRQQGITNV